MKNPSGFTEYYISGVWTDYTGRVSHYCVHQHYNPGVSKGKKFSKSELLLLMESSEVPFYVFGWDYKAGKFKQGDKVIIQETYNGKILWTSKKEDRTKDLKHLIHVNWFE